MSCAGPTICITTPTNNVVVTTTKTEVVKVITPGPQGPKGDTGNPGPGVKTGGLALQVLQKASNADYDTQWAYAPFGAPTFIQSTQPTSGQLLNATQYLWWDTSGGDLTLWIEDGV